MDSQGYEQVLSALKVAGVQARLTPRPEAGQDEVHCSLASEDGPLFSSDKTLKALADGGLMHYMPQVDPNTPSLEAILQSGSTITFRDHAAKLTRSQTP